MRLMRSFLAQKITLAVLAARQALTVRASYHVLGAGAGIGAAARTSSGLAEAYDSFRQEFGREGVPDAVGYETRLRHFRDTLAEVELLNARKGATWVAVVNRFADYTPWERRALLGYRRSASAPREEAPSSFLESRERGVSVAKSRDWRSKVQFSRDYVHDQGPCGSCWAVAAVGALEMHAELNGGQHIKPLSFEQLVDCVENKRQCGGSGGCDGATTELAFDYVAHHGLVEAHSYSGGYLSGKANNGKCPSSVHKAHAAIHIGGFKRLATNKVTPLLEYVSSTGPAVVSADASRWSLFGTGVFSECSPNATVNHAVLLVGYGHDPEYKKDYWLIRNSWGANWGEKGHIRLQRHLKDTGEEGHCGTDPDNQQGVGCKGDPKEVPVCGMCGVLSDSSYPMDVKVSHSHHEDA